MEVGRELSARRRSRGNVFRFKASALKPDFNLNELGQPVAPGEIGQIVVASCYMAAGYWRQPSLTAERFTGDRAASLVLGTGDMGRIDPQRAIEFRSRHGRARREISRQSYRIIEVEGALRRMPASKSVNDAIKRENKSAVRSATFVTEPVRLARLRTELVVALPD